MAASWEALRHIANGGAALHTSRDQVEARMIRGSAVWVDIETGVSTGEVIPMGIATYYCGWTLIGASGETDIAKRHKCVESMWQCTILDQDDWDIHE